MDWKSGLLWTWRQLTCTTHFVDNYRNSMTLYPKESGLWLRIGFSRRDCINRPIKNRMRIGGSVDIARCNGRAQRSKMGIEFLKKRTRQFDRLGKFFKVRQRER